MNQNDDEISGVAQIKTKELLFVGFFERLRRELSTMTAVFGRSFRLKKSIAYYFVLLFMSGCVNEKKSPATLFYTPASCSAIKKDIDWDDAIMSLNSISRLYKNSCFADVVDQVVIARKKLSHKTFSITKEAMEFLIPEGKVTDYVLESYERGYLGFLAAASYVNLNKQARILPELNKIYSEETALTYNHGRDPINTLVQAAMWDNFKDFGFSSRPFWLWLKQQKDIDPVVRKFAKEQIKNLDKIGTDSPRKWQIYELGRFPELDWELKFTDSEHGYFRIKTKQNFPPSCAENGALLLSTESWFTKISKRHAHSYHPLVNVKSWIRLPIGLLMGVSTFTTGAAIAIGGCVADGKNKAQGNLCELSIRGGKAVMDLSPGVTKYVLEPDLRHWQNLPAAIVIVPADDTASANPCLWKYPADRRRRML